MRFSVRRPPLEERIRLESGGHAKIDTTTKVYTQPSTAPPHPLTGRMELFRIVQK